MYSNIQIMRLKKLGQKSKLINVSRGNVYTKFARATTGARTMGPSPSKRKQAGGAATAMHCGSWRISYFWARDTFCRLRKQHPPNFTSDWLTMKFYSTSANRYHLYNFLLPTNEKKNSKDREF